MINTNSIYRRMIEEIEEHAIVLLDEKGHVKVWNKGAEKIQGYKRSEIIGKNFQLFYTEDDRARNLPDALLEMARRNGKENDEGWRVRKDGSLFWASVVITVIHDEAGQVIGFSKIVQDLTDKKGAEETEKAL